MSLKFEIICAFFVAFGATETISNLTYLIKKDGICLAKKQHKELPNKITCKQMKIKVLCMLCFGILFLSLGLYSYFTRSYEELSFIIALGTFALYALIEAIYYRFWKTFGAFIISILLFLSAILF